MRERKTNDRNRQGQVGKAEQEEMVSKVTTTSSATAASGLSRQTSIYSLTIDEFQNAVNEPNKSFGSMNMDEFLKNIWTAEESQAMAAAMVGGADVSNNASPANLARQPSLAKQGSLTLPRNMIGKTVDEVWREINANLSDNSNSASENKADEKSKAAVQRDPTFGEMTLEDFLAKAGVVREDCAVNQAANGAISSAVQSGLTQSPQQQQQDWINFQFKSNPHALQTQQQLQQQQMFTKPQHLMLSPQQQHQQQHLMLNTQQQQFQQQQQIQQLQHHHHQQQHQQQIQQHQPQQQQQQQQQLDASMPLFATRLMPPAGVPALQSSSTGSVLEASIESGATSSVVSVGFGKGLNLSPSMLSPETPGRGKKRGLDAPENKVVEQRQRRMIKNRESAARSRERKQAYTMELESEVTQLKEENALLNKQQVEATKKRRKQLMETLIPVEEMRQPPRVLRRTRTIHW